GVVARGHDVERVRVLADRGGDHVRQVVGARGVVATERSVDDPGAVTAGAVERVDHPIPVTGAVGGAVAVVVGEHLELLRLRVGRDAADPDAVAVERGDRAGDVRAVADVVVGGGVVVDVVPAVGGELAGEVGVIRVGAAVDDGDGDARPGARRQRPRPGDVHVGVGRAA